ncbi:MAG TPA: ECF-type sigma factor [Gemmatimonadaceae bacterium]|nr:ECF-type sigma factor [Gemmatimonadaceae bacterium]
MIDDSASSPARESFARTEVLLRGAREGDRASLDALFALAYDELRRIARRVRRGSPETLSTTALVHEAYLKLLPATVPANDAAHFKLLIARAMREALIDAARRRHADKRGGGELAITLDESIQSVPLKAAELLDLHHALEDLNRVDPRRAAVVECRFFGGLDVEETAEALDLSTATVKRDWRIARAWLAHALS